MVYLSRSIERSLDPSKAELTRTEKERHRQDLKDIIDILLHMPLRDGPMTLIDPDKPISIRQLKDANVDVQTAMSLTMMSRAVGGDVKCAEWVCKYGGLEPVKEIKATVEMPTFIDDIPDVGPEETDLIVEGEITEMLEEGDEQ